VVIGVLGRTTVSEQTDRELGDQQGRFGVYGPVLLRGR
jgi:hypothetical protein